MFEVSHVEREGKSLVSWKYEDEDGTRIYQAPTIDSFGNEYPTRGLIEIWNEAKIVVDPTFTVKFLNIENFKVRVRSYFDKNERNRKASFARSVAMRSKAPAACPMVLDRTYWLIGAAWRNVEIDKGIEEGYPLERFEIPVQAWGDFLADYFRVYADPIALFGTCRTMRYVSKNKEIISC